MASPAFWTRDVHMKPFGSSTALDLCQYLPPKTPARALLLGCGDPRSILTTLSLSEPDARAYDFTCCDEEPAIMARSILMLSFIMDGQPSSIIWDIHCNMRLDEEASSLLIKQCEKLVGFAADMTSWRESPYGKVLRICTAHTLVAVSRLWTRYTQREYHSGLLATQLEEKRKAVAHKLISRPGWNLSASPCAGAFFTYVNPLGSVHFNEYWETGFSTHTLGEKHIPKYLNPTLAFCRTRPHEWPLHPDSDPIKSFHFATAFAGIEGEPTNGACRMHTTMDVLAKTVRKEFADWCTSFASFAQHAPGSVTLRFVVAEALAFCQAIQYYAATGSCRSGQFVSPWTAQELVLDSGEYGSDSSAPTTFNIIDTSNLMNGLGLLNILACASPLLEREPYSVLTTEALFSIAGDGPFALPARTLTDPSVTALLFGLTPTSFVTNVSTQASMHEVLAHLIKGAPKGFDFYHERLVWKFSYLGDQAASRNVQDLSQRITVDPKQLAQTLFAVYQNMFQPENSKSYGGVPTKRGLAGMSNARYGRASFAALVRIARDRTSTDWPAAIDHLINLIRADKSVVVGTNYFHELLCHLYIRGLYTTPGWNHLSIVPEDDRESGPFATWSDTPLVSCVVVVVPRDRLRALEKANIPVGDIPLLQCEVLDPVFKLLRANASVQAVFGSLNVSDAGEASIQEDEAGWAGDSDLLAMFWTPTWNLLLHPQSISIRVALKPATESGQLMRILGTQLEIFAADLTDKKHVHVFRDRPNAPGELTRLDTLSFPVTDPLPDSEVDPVAVEFGYDPTKQLQTVLAFKRQWTVRDPALQQALSSGRKVVVTQRSPCTLTISLGSVSKDISFPYPVEGTAHKLQVTRKSFLIEIEVPAAGHRTSGGFSQDCTPVVCTPSGPVSWNAHYIDLDKMPKLNANRPEDYTHALYPHVSLIFSDREGDIRDAFGPGRITPVPLIEIKDTIFSIFLTSSGMEGPKQRVFGIGDSDKGGTNALIFVTGVRLDLPAHTIVADAFVLPIDRKGLAQYKRPLNALSKEAYIFPNQTHAVSTAWKKLLPAFVERCRTWEHKPTCEYQETGSIPLSLEALESPICSCGKGVGTEEFEKVKEWKPFAPSVTRLAISSIFTPTYMESVAGVEKRLAERGAKNEKPWTEMPNFTPTATQTTQTRPRRSRDIGKQCAACGKSGEEIKLLICGRCKKVSYCSQDCQKDDWKNHKSQCRSKA